MHDFDNDDLEFLAAQARAEHVADDLRDEVERLKAINADLLEALEKLEEYADGFSVSCVYLNEETEGKRLLMKARAAIAKAKGEQQ